MVDRKLFNWNFEPIVQPLEYVKIVPPLREKEEFYEVEWVEAVPYVEIDFGSLSSGQEADKELEYLYVGRYEVAQYRFRVLTSGLEVIALRRGGQKAQSLWLTNKTIGKVPYGYEDATIVERLQTTEFYQPEDDETWITIKNASTSDLSETKIAFYGYVFVVRPVDFKPNVFKPIFTVSRRGISAT